MKSIASAGAALAVLAVLALAMLETSQVARCAADVSAKPYRAFIQKLPRLQVGCTLTC
jgi:hypothetical protein